MASCFLSRLACDELVIEGQLTVGDFGALFGMYMGLQGTFQGLGRLWLNIQDQARRLRVACFSSWISWRTTNSTNQVTNWDRFKRGVQIENVGFKYPNGHEALKDINLDLRIGEVVAIVGPTGSGKTSLAYLLPAFLKPTSGRVLIDDHDLMQIDLESLRKTNGIYLPRTSPTF